MQNQGPRSAGAGEGGAGAPAGAEVPPHPRPGETSAPPAALVPGRCIAGRSVLEQAAPARSNLQAVHCSRLMKQ